MENGKWKMENGKWKLGLLAWLVLIAYCLLSTAYCPAQVPVSDLMPPHAYRVGFQVVCAGAGDCVTIGYASKTLRVREVWVAKPSNAITVSLNLHSAADSGGTSTTPAGVPLNSNDLAATGVVTAYTAAPTAGTSVGTIAMLPMATTDTWVQDFGTLNDEVLALQSTGQALAVYVSGAATITVNLEWSE